MNRSYVIFPVVLTLCFVGYAVWYSSEKERTAVRTRDEATRSRNAAIEAVFSGVSFVGRDGKSEAEADILRGTPKLLLYGKTSSDVVERSAVLKLRFGVSIDPLAGCIVNEPLIAFADAYNATIRSYVDSKFGPNSMKAADREAMELWEAKRNEKRG